ncbi:MAG TPA: cation diffusion facilitator family transporter [Clostridia bacterium]
MSDHTEHEHHEHEHSHAGHAHDASALSGKKIFWVTVLNLTITIAEIIGGLLSGSLALLSDSLHNLSDSIAIALSYFANKVAQRPKNPRKTFGYKRAEILAAFINATALITISVFLIIAAIRRWRTPETINGTMMILVASIGLVANLVSVFLLEKDSHGNLNIKSSYLHLISDTVSSVGVVAGGIAIKLWGLVWIDPLVTVLISLYVLKEAWHILKKTIDILMQSSADIDYEKIRQEIEAIEHVRNIHHVHSWMSNESTIFFEAHLDFDDMSLCEAQVIYDQIERLLKEEYGVSHVTLQAESDKCDDKTMFDG